jgi:thymidylate synthase ThyX
MITADIVLDSVNGNGDRLTTFKLRYPRFIHPQLLMHRAFSRSCSSSRAIPTQTLIGEVMRNPVPFTSLAKNKAGMQPGDLLEEEESFDAQRIIEEHRDFSVLCALQLAKMGVHKQWANRLLEPHSHISVILTVSNHPGSFPNFMELRHHEDAQDEIDVLATKMGHCYEGSKPTFLTDGEWHVPLVTHEERVNLSPTDLVMVSSARCARTSYNRHDNSNPVVEDDKALSAKLYKVKHLNPFEHQARANCSSEGFLCGNFVRGWEQNRKLLERGQYS